VGHLSWLGDPAQVAALVHAHLDRAQRAPLTPEDPAMQTRVAEIADRIYRLSTFMPDVGSAGFTFNQFLIDGEQPLLFHTGHKALFPLVSEATATITPLARCAGSPSATSRRTSAVP
jgi:hypothetical protein